MQTEKTILGTCRNCEFGQDIGKQPSCLRRAPVALTMTRMNQITQQPEPIIIAIFPPQPGWCGDYLEKGGRWCV